MNDIGREMDALKGKYCLRETIFSSIEEIFASKTYLCLTNWHMWYIFVDLTYSAQRMTEYL